MRSNKILYRIRRQLKQYWPDSIQDNEIYDIMNQGQTDVLTMTRPVTTMSGTIDTVIDQEAYGLVVDTYNIGSIQEILWPTDWEQSIVEVNPIQWDETTRIVVTNSTEQPRFYTITNKKILLYPVPSTVETITYWAYPDFAAEITGLVEPIIPAYWDKALELYVMSELSTGVDKVNFLNLYQKELNDKAALAFKTSLSTVSRTKNTDW